MANEEVLGAKFSIDITSLKAGLRQANSLIKESNSQFKAAAAGMDDWQNSQDGVSAKLKNLNEVYDLQKTKVEALQAEYEQCIADGLDPMSTSAVNMRTNINNATADMNRTQSEIQKYTDRLEELKNQTDETGEAAEDSADNLEKMGEAAEDAGDGFTVAKGALATFIADGLLKLIDSCKNAISSFVNLAEETQEYREDIGKLKTAWESAGKSTELATETYKNFYAVLGEEDRSVEAVNHLAKFVDTEQDMAKWTDICTGVWGTFGDSLPIEGLTEAANETAKVGKLTGVLADAVNWAGVNEDEFQANLDKCNTEQERAAYITETLNGLYSVAAKNYKKNNKSIIDARKAQSDYTDTLAEFGELAEPLTTKVKDGFNRILQSILKLVDKSKLDKFGKTIDKAFDGLINKVLPKLISGIEFVIQNGGTIVSILGAIGAGFAAMKVTKWVTSMIGGIKGIASALKTAEGAQKAFNKAQAANIIGVVVAAVVALVEAIKSFSEMASEAVNGWDALNEAAEKNNETNKKWQESMDEAQAALGDYTSMTTASGESTSDLEAKMADAQANITAIFQNAFNENRQLRDDEVASVRRFNEEYLAAQQELAELEAAILKAQSDSLEWQLGNMELSAEETQGVLNTLNDVRGQYNDKMQELVVEEVALLDMRYQKGVISEQEYNTLREQALAKQAEYNEKGKQITQDATNNALAHMGEMVTILDTDFTNREHAYNSISEIKEHFQQRIAKIDADETKSGWDKFWEKQAILNEEARTVHDFTTGQEVNWTDYNFMTDQNISRNTQAFFNWLTQTKKSGKELTAENKTTAKNILDAYASLPPELQEVGFDSLAGFASGMSEEYPELKTAASTDMDGLLSAMRTALDINSPSRKAKTIAKQFMEGFKEGMEEKEDDLTTSLSGICGALLGIAEGALRAISKKLSEAASKASGINASNSGGGKKVKMAKGGIVRKATNILAGEAGAEAIIPLEKNTKWIDAVADKVASRDKNVVINQTNNYSQAHSRYEIYKSKQQTVAAVRLAMQGG